MRTILQQLYDGDVFPAEQFYPKTEQYKVIRKQHFNRYQEFNAKLETIDPALSNEFVQIMDEQLDTVPIEFSEMFIEGFRLGAKIVVEVYAKEIPVSN